MVRGFGHHHRVDHDPGDLHRPRMQRVQLGHALDLGDHQAARVLGRHRHRQIVQRQRLALHAEIAGGIGCGAADECDVNRERLVEQPLLPAELEQLHELLGRGGVDLAAGLARVDEGAQAHLGEGAGFAGGDVAVEVRDHPLRQVVGLDPVLHGQPADLGDQAPMPADHPLEQPVMPEPIEAQFLAVALPRREQQRQVARLSRVEKPPFQPGQQIVRRADADEARGADRVAATDQRHGLGQAHHLVALLALAEATLVRWVGGHDSAPLIVWPRRILAPTTG